MFYYKLDPPNQARVFFFIKCPSLLTTQQWQSAELQNPPKSSIEIFKKCNKWICFVSKPNLVNTNPFSIDQNSFDYGFCHNQAALL